MEEDNSIIKATIETGAEISGSVASALIGGALAGPAGIVLGAVGGPLVIRLFRKVGLEFHARVMGPRQVTRIGAAYAFAINKIIENGKSGIPIRDDDFFDENMNYRSTAEEVLEGVLFSAQKEYEERKVKHIGILYGNIATCSAIDRGHANQLVKAAESLSFRQYCIIQTFKEPAKYSIAAFIGVKDAIITKSDVISEIYDLVDIGLLALSDIYISVDNSRPIELKIMNITESGKSFCQLLSLDQIEDCEVNRVISQMNLKISGT